MTQSEYSPRDHVVIDGYNVLHAVLLSAERRELATSAEQGSDNADGSSLRWWLPAYQLRVVQWAEALYRNVTQARRVLESAADDAVAVRMTLVFDASGDVQEEQRLTSEVLTVVYATNADDFIVEICRQGPAIVVTADRALVNRARRWGARAVKPWNVDNELR